MKKVTASSYRESIKWHEVFFYWSISCIPQGHQNLTHECYYIKNERSKFIRCVLWILVEHLNHIPLNYKSENWINKTDASSVDILVLRVDFSKKLNKTILYHHMFRGALYPLEQSNVRHLWKMERIRFGTS